MTDYGLTLLCELHGPDALVDTAVKAEAAGFDFLVISDHFHPWLPSHGHSPFAWSVLGAVAARTESIGLATMVTCPFGRYHPAVIAQAAATMAVMSGGRFTLGVGAGERLNEHITGAGWPSVDVRHTMLSESIHAIRALWTGEPVTFRGERITVDDAVIYDLPADPIDIYMGVSGARSVCTATELGIGMCMVEPNGDLVSEYTSRGGEPAQVWGQVGLAWAHGTDAGARLAHERFRFGSLGWPVMAELPHVSNFAAATRFVRPEDVAESVPAGNDPKKVVEAIGRFTDAGVNHVAVVDVGDDLDAFLRAWVDDIRPNLAN